MCWSNNAFQGWTFKTSIRKKFPFALKWRLLDQGFRFFRSFLIREHRDERGRFVNCLPNVLFDSVYAPVSEITFVTTSIDTGVVKGWELAARTANVSSERQRLPDRKNILFSSFFYDMNILVHCIHTLRSIKPLYFVLCTLFRTNTFKERWIATGGAFNVSISLLVKVKEFNKSLSTSRVFYIIFYVLYNSDASDF